MRRSSSSPLVLTALLLAPVVAASAAETPLARAGRLLKLEQEASALADAGEVDQALERLEAVLAETPRRIPALALRARLLRESSRYLELIESVDELPTRIRRDFRILRETARAILETAGVDAALFCLDESRPPATWRSEWWLLRAEVHAQAKDAEKTLRALKNAVYSGFIDPQRITSDRAFAFLPRGAELEKILGVARKKHQYQSLSPLDRGAKRPPEAREGYSLKELRGWLRYTRNRGTAKTTIADMSQLDGAVFSTEDLRGKGLIVVAWAHWSPISCDMVKTISRLLPAAREKGVEIRLAAVDLFDQGLSFHAHSQNWLDQQDIAIPCAAVGRKSAAEKLGIQAVPVTFFFGQDGGLYLYAPATLSDEALGTLIDDLVSPLPERAPSEKAPEKTAEEAPEDAPENVPTEEPNPEESETSDDS